MAVDGSEAAPRSDHERQELVDALRSIANIEEQYRRDELARGIEDELGIRLPRRHIETRHDLFEIVEACLDQPGGPQALARVVRRMHQLRSGPVQNATVDSLTLVDPGFAGESVFGQDLLGIQHDAQALAMLLVSVSLQPPLAIGLYGEWGSGKTFFMRTVEDQIRQLIQMRQPGTKKRVASVWFNAWHYAEGNLWASLLHEIFLSLRGARSGLEEALDAALAEVDEVRGLRTGAFEAAARAQRDVETAREQLAELEARHESAKSDAAHLQARDVWSTFTVDPTLREHLNDVTHTLGLPDVGTSARELARAVEEVKATVQRGRALATVGPWWTSPLVVGVLLAVTIAGIGLLLGVAVDSATSWLGPAVAVASQIAGLVSGAAAWLTRQNALARRLLTPAEQIQRQIDVRLGKAEAKYRAEAEQLRQHLRELETNLAQARESLAEAEASGAAAMERLQQMTGARLLERYLSERIAKAEYRQYLGLVALAHRDLRDLDAYLRAAADTGDETAIDRIVLYIDDLDRCAPDTVVRVLEAVHLLLALPLFVVVVGVDERWLRRSLAGRHSSDVPSPSAYLDKIFQLTYRLPHMTPERCAELLVATARATQASPLVPDAGSTEPMDPSVPESAPTVSDTPDMISLVFTKDDLTRLDRVAPLVGTSPRTAKRFLNVYRLVRARHLMSAGQGNATAGVVLTALVIGVPIIAAAIDQQVGMGPNAAGTLFAWVIEWARTLPANSPERQRTESFFYRAAQDDDISFDEILTWLPVVRAFAWPMAD